MVDSRCDIQERGRPSAAAGTDTAKLQVPGCVPAACQVGGDPVHQIALPALAPPAAVDQDEDRPRRLGMRRQSQVADLLEIVSVAIRGRRNFAASDEAAHSPRDSFESSATDRHDPRRILEALTWCEGRIQVQPDERCRARLDDGVAQLGRRSVRGPAEQDRFPTSPRLAHRVREFARLERIRCSPCGRRRLGGTRARSRNDRPEECRLR